MLLFGVILDRRFFANSGLLCCWGSTLRYRNPLLSSTYQVYSRSFNENKMVGCRYNSCLFPLHSGTCYFEDDFGWALFLAIQAVFVVGGPLWDVCRHPLLSSNKFTQGHLMKLKSLVANITAVGSPYIAERASFGVILVARCFDQFRPSLLSGSQFVM